MCAEACQVKGSLEGDVREQALPSFLTALPLTHLDVSACRNTDLSVVADMTRLATLSLQVRLWDPALQCMLWFCGATDVSYFAALLSSLYLDGSVIPVCHVKCLIVGCNMREAP